MKTKDNTTGNVSNSVINYGSVGKGITNKVNQSAVQSTPAELLALLAQIQHSLPAMRLHEDDKTLLKSTATMAAQEAAKPAPQKARLQSLLKSVEAILEIAAGDLLAEGFAVKLAAWLGAS